MNPALQFLCNVVAGVVTIVVFCAVKAILASRGPK